MTKQSKQLIIILTFVGLLFTIFGTIQTSAQATFNNAYKVNTNKGLNLRKSNCEYIMTLAYGTLLSSSAGSDTLEVMSKNPETKTCAIEGTKYIMIPVTYTYGERNDSKPSSNGTVEGYVALSFVEAVVVDLVPSFEAGYYIYVDASLGLNVRDKNCKRQNTLANKSPLNITLYSSINTIFCKVNNVTYAMTPINYIDSNKNTQQGYVATAFIQSYNKTYFDRNAKRTCPDSYIYSVYNDTCTFTQAPGIDQGSKPTTVPPINR